MPATLRAPSLASPSVLILALAAPVTNPHRPRRLRRRTHSVAFYRADS